MKMDINIVAYHVVEGVVDRLHNLLVPLLVAVLLVMDVIDVHRPEKHGGPHPFQEHCVSILASQVGYNWRSWSSDISHHHQGLRAFSIILSGVGFDPDLILRVRF